jgi:hypothetical protein
MHTNAFVLNVRRVLGINVSIHVMIDHNYQYTGLSPSVWEFRQEWATFHAASCIGRLDATEPRLGAEAKRSLSTRRTPPYARPSEGCFVVYITSHRVRVVSRLGEL